MKITTAQISNYKCIRDPCCFDVSDITCLVGMNESGKTAILEALYRLNPIIPESGTFNVDDDYPRIDVEDYRVDVKSGRKQPAVVTRATFALSAEDCKELENDYPGAAERPELVLSKGYDNRLLMEIPVKEEAVVQALLKNAGVSPQHLKAHAKTSTLADLAQLLEGNEAGDASLPLGPVVAQMQEKGIGRYLAEKYLRDRIPRFMYFDEFYQMAGHVNIEGLIQRQKDNRLLESDYPLLGLIDLARLDLEEIVSPRRALERDNRLEGASNHLSNTLMQYWSQNAFLEMRFDIRPGLPNDPEGMKSGTNLWCHVYNSRQKVRTLLGNRSRGFIWFFSFLAWYSQHKRKGIPLILLLDEPALFLHGTAQRDLLRYLEDESRTGHQVIYTTQSPYMIDARRFDRVRIVEDKGAQGNGLPAPARMGTRVCTDAQDASVGSILPLRGALADGLFTNIFSQKDILIVGDVPDLLFCETVSSLLVAGGAEGLDPRWKIVPIGGAEKLAAFLSLVGDQRDAIAASPMVIRKSELGALDDLLKRNLLQKENIFFYGAFTGADDADIEDMFDPEFYLSLVNSEYHDSLGRPIKKSQLRAEGGRITAMIASCLESASPSSKVQFDRYRPARYFAENSASLQSAVSNDTWQRFQEMFKRLNAVLPHRSGVTA
jgi:predicted ATPase